ncbi:MAG: hypothetical protein HY644_11470 [Acidobacteria bacterium]|nr:hypothetical protein [Acidobacteriota bacterium]
MPERKGSLEERSRKGPSLGENPIGSSAAEGDWLSLLWVSLHPFRTGTLERRCVESPRPHAYRWVTSFILGVLIFSVSLTSVVAQPGGVSPSNFSLVGFRRQITWQPKAGDVAQATGLQSAWLTSFGLVSLQSLTHNRNRAQITILEMIDPAGAYGLFTLAAAPLPFSLPIGGGAKASENRLIFWKSNYFFLMQGTETALLATWAEELQKQVSGKDDLPIVVELLPRKDLNVATVQFFVKDLIPSDGRLGEMRSMLGVNKSVQAAIGRYFPSEKRLIVLGYPTYALALESFERVKGYVKDKSHGVYAKRAGVVLALTEEMPKQQALELLDKIQYTPSVKWIVDKQDPRPKGGGVPFLLNTVVGSLALSFLFLLATAVLGTALGVFRFYLRLISPDNFLDRPQRAGMIRLKLVDK